MVAKRKTARSTKKKTARRPARPAAKSARSAKTTKKSRGAAPRKAAGRKPASRGTNRAAKKANQAAKAAAPATPWVWHEVMTGDVSKARSFYGSLLGWKAQDMPMPGGHVYTIFSHGDQQVGGCMAIPDAGGQPACPPNWTSYIGVQNVDATVEKARTLGATVHVPGTDIPQIGRFAVLADPTGATFAVYQSLR